MEYAILDEQSKQIWQAQIFDLCLESDREFVPPLSYRSSTTQASLQAGESNGITAYFRQVMAQQVLVCLEEGRVMGFVSFREDYQPEHYPAAKMPNLYISTLILSPESRGRGLTKALYRYLFCEKYPQHHIYTRTWSQNFAHIKILSHFGFREILRLKDHRGAGVDTVYFAKE